MKRSQNLTCFFWSVTAKEDALRICRLELKEAIKAARRSLCRGRTARGFHGSANSPSYAAPSRIRGFVEPTYCSFVGERERTVLFLAMIPNRSRPAVIRATACRSPCLRWSAFRQAQSCRAIPPGRRRRINLGLRALVSRMLSPRLASVRDHRLGERAQVPVRHSLGQAPVRLSYKRE